MQQDITHVTSRAQQVRVAPRAGTWLWIWQRLTAYGLVLFLGVHIYFTYFARLDAPRPLTAADFSRQFNLYPVIFALNEWLLLVCALFHGFNGLRNMLFDWLTNSGLRTILTWLLVLFGIGLAIYGGWTLWTLASLTM